MTTPIGSNLHTALPHRCGNFSNTVLGWRGLQEDNVQKTMRSCLFLGKMGDVRVPSLALTQQSCDCKTRTRLRSESTLCSLHGKHYGNWRGTQEGEILK